MAVSDYGELVFGKTLEEVDPLIHELICREEERQNRKIILIPSESICPGPVRQALGSVFTSIYAEGYPPKRMTLDPEKRTLLQVLIDDAVEADSIFSVLMGDQVEPRRDFIERNALNVRNLDI